MKPPAELIDAVIKQHIAPLLKDVGFTKNGRTWYLDRTDVVAVINLQANRWNQLGDAQFFFNFANWYPGLEDLLGTRPCENRKPKSDQWMVSYSFHPSNSQWWRIQDWPDVDAAGAAIAADLADRGLPRLLDRMDPVARLKLLVTTNRQMELAVALGLSVGRERVAEAFAEGRSSKELFQKSARLDT